MKIRTSFIMKKEKNFFHEYLPFRQVGDQLLFLQNFPAAKWISEVLQYQWTQSSTSIWLS